MKRAPWYQSDQIQNQLRLIIVLAKNDFTAKYKTTYFGFAWMLITPFIQMVIITLVFSHFFPEANYAYYVLIGLICWQFVSTTISLATYSLTNQASLLHKTRICAGTLPVAAVLSSGFNFIGSLTVIALVLAVIQLPTPTLVLSLIYAMVAVIWLTWITGMLSIMTASLYVYFRDIGHAIQSVLMMWFYATPVIWPQVYLPQSLHWILWLNPLVAPLSLLRASLGLQAQLNQEIILGNLLVTLSITSITLLIYKKLHANFVDYV